MLRFAHNFDLKENASELYKDRYSSSNETENSLSRLTYLKVLLLFYVFVCSGAHARDSTYVVPSCLLCYTQQGSISPTFCEQLLRMWIQKAQKYSQVVGLILFSGSAHVKAGRKLLVKLTPGIPVAHTNTLSLTHKNRTKTPFPSTHMSTCEGGSSLEQVAAYLCFVLAPSCRQ